MGDIYHKTLIAEASKTWRARNEIDPDFEGLAKNTVEMIDWMIQEVCQNKTLEEIDSILDELYAVDTPAKAVKFWNYFTNLWDTRRTHWVADKELKG